MVEVNFPSSLNLQNSLKFGSYINSLAGGVDYAFDFGALRYIGPLGLVYISSCIEELGLRCSDNEPTGFNFEHLRYPAHMGFFQVFDLDHGNLPGEGESTSRCIPITVLNAQEIRAESAGTGTAIGSIVEVESKRLASVLIQEAEGDLLDTVAYSIREILRNAVEHSHTKTVRYCAQYYPGGDTVEVAILDKGRGILESFKNNPYVEPSSHREAINFSLLPGVSGTAFKGSKINTRKDDWKNSGYGLYMTNRICRLGGDFFIGSQDSGVSLKEAGKEYHKVSHNGTMLRLTIRASEVSNLTSRLLGFSEEGKVWASRLRGTVLTPSSASHMLTVDYQEG